ncbi:hypothetical protein WJX73_003307 [Symbiochloris irregularis]|uniref:Uncharacterized protein n=1 Tax=Symbiochloris irregularis TaxID=706552 RepID=A0AAW1NMV1_9CHLO
MLQAHWKVSVLWQRQPNTSSRETSGKTFRRCCAMTFLLAEAAKHKWRDSYCTAPAVSRRSVKGTAGHGSYLCPFIALSQALQQPHFSRPSLSR